jgi:hypothetical protein
MSVLRRENRLPMTIIGRGFNVHRSMRVEDIAHELFGSQKVATVIDRAIVLHGCFGSTGE